VKSAKVIAALSGAVLVALLVCSGCIFPLELLYHLVTGWALYLYRVVPEMEISWSGVATAGVCLGILAGGLHRFLRWLYTAERPHAAKPRPVWRTGWTAALLGVVVLMFVAGIAAIGVTHQTAWLATSPEPLLESGAAARVHAINQLHQLAIAMHDYAGEHGDTFPPSAVFGTDGEALLSWRVLVLPYVEEEKLFEEFRRNEPWDSPHNLRLLPRMPKLYASVSRRGNPRPYCTFFQVPVGTGAAFEGREGMNIKRDFQDGTSGTILIVEAASAVPWTKPADVAYRRGATLLPALGGMSPDYFLVALADGSARMVSKKALNERTLRRLIERNLPDLDRDW
jgi:hypothetical protein